MNDAVGNAGAVARPPLPRRWRTRLALLALGLAGAGAAVAQVQVQGTLQADQPGPQVSRNVFGQFAEHLGTGIYGGIWVGEDSKIPNTRGYRNDVLAALRALEVPQLRWPGGCFADDYHWRDGIGRRKDRPVRINSNWGGVEEDNAFGLHEFMGLAELIGAAPYIAGNVGSAPPSEMAQWLEYMTATHGSLAAERAANGHPAPWTVPYFGIGNELWGCGGNMRPEYTVDVYRRYQTFLRPQPGQTLFRIAPGPNEDDTTLTETLMRGAGRYIDGLSLHYYTIPPSGWPPRASSTTFDEAGWIQTLSRALLMDDYLARHSAIMDKYDPQRRVALVVDEWGTWYAPLPGTNPGFLQQQNTLRDALVASVTLDVFTAHAERVRMANIAQMVNVLQAMLLTDGPRMLRTPSYHVFMLYKPWRDATALPLKLETPAYRHAGLEVPAVHGSAVRGADGHLHVALSNLDPGQPARVRIALRGASGTRVSGQVLTAPDITSANTFAAPDTVRPAPFDGARLADGVLTATLPPRALVVLDLP